MSDDIKSRIDDLQRRHSAAVQKKAGLAGQLQAKREELEAIVKEIREAGYDPKKITQERDRAKAELEAQLTKLESELTAVETALAAFQGNSR
jgi:septal ring factor EnvC (AmiA/AmiB activator)